MVGQRDDTIPASSSQIGDSIRKKSGTLFPQSVDDFCESFALRQAARMDQPCRGLEATAFDNRRFPNVVTVGSSTDQLRQRNKLFGVSHRAPFPEPESGWSDAISGI